jgi:hypothetical protein
VLRVYAVTIIPILLVTVVLAVASHISPERVGEIAQLGLVVVGGLLLVFPWLPQLQSNRFPHL